MHGSCVIVQTPQWCAALLDVNGLLALLGLQGACRHMSAFLAERANFSQIKITPIAIELGTLCFIMLASTDLTRG